MDFQLASWLAEAGITFAEMKKRGMTRDDVRALVGTSDDSQDEALVDSPPRPRGKTTVNRTPADQGLLGGELTAEMAAEALVAMSKEGGSYQEGGLYQDPYYADPYGHYGNYEQHHQQQQYHQQQYQQQQYQQQAGPSGRDGYYQYHYQYPPQHQPHHQQYAYPPQHQPHHQQYAYPPQHQPHHQQYPYPPQPQQQYAYPPQHRASSSPEPPTVGFQYPPERTRSTSPTAKAATPALDKILTSSGRINIEPRQRGHERTWLTHFNNLQDHLVAHSEYPTHTKTSPSPLGQWCGRQRKHFRGVGPYKGGSAMPKHRIELMEQLPGWRWEGAPESITQEDMANWKPVWLSVDMTDD